MAGRVKPAERVKGRSVNLGPTAWEALRRRAFEERTTISEQIRRAVAEYLGGRQRGKSGGGRRKEGSGAIRG